MFADSVSGDIAGGFRGYLFGNTGLNVPYTATLAGSMAARHHERTNLTFFDGHAKWFKCKSLLGNPNATINCQDPSMWLNPYLDMNEAHIKFNVSDSCIPDLWKGYAGSGQCDRFCSKISVLAGLPMMP
jgi:prepilin-type processing-associated H-X9-DG protein